MIDSIKVSHHPEAELLAGFTAGSLSLSQSLCVSTHLENCLACRESVQRLKGVGSQMFSEQAPASISKALRESVFAKLRADESEQSSNEIRRDNVAKTETLSAESIGQDVRQSQVRGVPRCLEQFVGKSFDTVKWSHVAKGIFSAELCRDVNGAKVELIRMKAGASLFTHTHLGEEVTVVLDGSFSDSEGVYQRGDFVLCDQSHEHAPAATLDVDCLCLAVTNAPIQFTGFFSRWLNPLLRRSYA